MQTWGGASVIVGNEFPLVFISILVKFYKIHRKNIKQKENRFKIFIRAALSMYYFSKRKNKTQQRTVREHLSKNM